MCFRELSYGTPLQDASFIPDRHLVHPTLIAPLILTRSVQTRKADRPTKLRPTLTPGTALILLAGRFRGKRVVLLRHLSQGVLLVTGPFKVNGVPLRRVNARYVIATSVKVDLSGLDDATVDKVAGDGYFDREKPKKGKKGEEEFFAQAEKPEVCGEPFSTLRRGVVALTVLRTEEEAVQRASDGSKDRRQDADRQHQEGASPDPVSGQLFQPQERRQTARDEVVKAMAWEGECRTEKLVGVTCSCRVSTEANSCEKWGTSSTSIVLDSSMLALSVGAFMYEATVDCNIYGPQTTVSKEPNSNYEYVIINYAMAPWTLLGGSSTYSTY